MNFGYFLSTLALLGAAGAQNTTSTLLLFGFDAQSLVGSVLASGATATTYVVGCADPSPEKCGLGQSKFTFTQGPSTYEYTQIVVGESTEGAVTYRASCAITTDHALCAHTVNGFNPDASETDFSSIETTSINSSDFQEALQAVTITAGPALTSSPSTPTITSVPASGTASGVAKTSSAAATASVPSSSSTGGAPTITNGPLLFLGGVLAFAAM